MLHSNFLDFQQVRWVLNILKLNTSAYRCCSTLSGVELGAGWRGKNDENNEDNQRNLAVDLGLNLFKQFCVSFYCYMKTVVKEWEFYKTLFLCHLKCLWWSFLLLRIKFLRIIQMSWLNVWQNKQTNPVMTRAAAPTVLYFTKSLWFATGVLSR